MFRCAFEWNKRNWTEQDTSLLFYYSLSCMSCISVFSWKWNYEIFNEGIIEIDLNLMEIIWHVARWRGKVNADFARKEVRDQLFGFLIKGGNKWRNLCPMIFSQFSNFICLFNFFSLAKHLLSMNFFMLIYFFFYSWFFTKKMLSYTALTK